MQDKNVRQYFWLVTMSVWIFVLENRKMLVWFFARQKCQTKFCWVTKMSVWFFARQNYQSYFLREENGGLIFWVAKNVSLIFRVTKMSVLIFALENVILFFCETNGQSYFSLTKKSDWLFVCDSMSVLL